MKAHFLILRANLWAAIPWVISCLLAGCGLLSPSSGGDDDDVVTLPLRYELAGAATPVGTCDDEGPGWLRMRQEAAGTGRLVGDVAWQSTQCVNFATLEGRPSEGTLTTAAGDELHFRFTTRVTGADPAAGVYTWEDDLEVAGGTGRFAEAGGTATNVGSASLTFGADGLPVFPVSFAVETHGEITYPR